MFPEGGEISRQIDLLNTDKKVISRDHSAITGNARLMRLEVVRDLYGSFVLCSLCSEQCRDMYYPCEFCDLGNYNMCHKCFVEGKHCRDGAHLLARINIEALVNKELIKRVTYYSSVDEKGGREEIVIYLSLCMGKSILLATVIDSMAQPKQGKGTPQSTA